MRMIHRTSAVVLLVFIAAHLANHLLALKGIEAHIAVMKQLRACYRHPFAEGLLLIAVLAQVITGSLLFWRTRRSLRGFWPRLRTYSGLAIAFFLLQHVPAVLFGRLLQGFDTNFYFAAAVLQGGVHQYYFLLYYLVGVTSASCTSPRLCIFVYRMCGGGKASASSIPIRGPARIAKFIFAVRDKGGRKSFYALRLNNTFGVLSYAGEAPYALQLFEFGAHDLQASYVIRNPDKLQHFSDRQALLRAGIIKPLTQFMGLKSTLLMLWRQLWR